MMNTGLIHIPYKRPTRKARQTFDWAFDNAIARRPGRLHRDDGRRARHAEVGVHSQPRAGDRGSRRQTDADQVRADGAPAAPPPRRPAWRSRSGWLSQILEGRYFLGIGAGAYPNDAILQGLPADTSENHGRVRECFEIMKRVWEREPFQYEGQYFKGGFPEEQEAIQVGDEQHKMADYSPWGGKVEVAVTGLSPESPSMRFAGENGFIPVSIFSGSKILKRHWEIYEEAALENGHVADRSRYHVSQTVLVADTDAEAKRRAMEGGIGYAWTHYLWPIWERFDLLSGFVADKGARPEDVDLEWICDNVWIVGSPETCVRKLNELFEFCGGWGTLQVESHDYMDDPEPWFESLQRIVDEVAPHVKLPEPVSTAAR